MQNKAVSFYAIRLLPAVLVALVAHNLWRWRESSLYWRAAPYSLSPQINEPPIPEQVDTHPLALSSQSSTVLADFVKGAESFSLSPSGVLYTGTANGELLELLPNEKTNQWQARTIGHFGRVLGLRSVSIGYSSDDNIMHETLLVCDSASGLLEIEISRAVSPGSISPARTANKQTILSMVEGRPVTVCNGITFKEDVEDGLHVVISDSSELPLHMLGAEVFAENGSGRVIHFAYSRWKQSNRDAEEFSRVVLDKLRFPNGVQFLSLSKSGDAQLLVLECLGRALLHIDFNLYSGRATKVEADWVGTFHGDNIQPLRPRWPVGALKLPREIAPAVHEWGLSDLPEHIYLVGVPHCTSRLQETFLYTSSRLRKFISSWVPLPIRISLGNPVLFSNSAVAIYDSKQRTIIASFKAGKGSLMKFTTEALVTKATQIQPGKYDLEFILGAFAGHIPILEGKTTLDLSSH